MGWGPSIVEYLTQVTLRPRRALISPMLVETAPNGLRWRRSDVPEEMRQGIRRQLDESVHKFYRYYADGMAWRFSLASDDSLIIEQRPELSQADWSVELSTSGYRFPTPDEWEYLCGCGQPTLFRWGDHADAARYPSEAGSDQTPNRDSASPVVHRRPNAFGLVIAYDPYKYELTSSIGVTRGGDGGVTICGGAGFFLGWLSLATAYFEDYSCRREPPGKIDNSFTVGRRVLDLR